jgi:hypothetical protein
MEGVQMNNNIPLNSTDLGVGKQMEPNMIEWRKSSKAILTIHADGRITVSEDCKPTETAAEVLQIMREQWLSDIQCAKIRELQSNLNESNELVEYLQDRIKRLEEVGDEVVINYVNSLSAFEMWRKAKEAKP